MKLSPILIILIFSSRLFCVYDGQMNTNRIQPVIVIDRITDQIERAERFIDRNRLSPMVYYRKANLNVNHELKPINFAHQLNNLRKHKDSVDPNEPSQSIIKTLTTKSNDTVKKYQSEYNKTTGTCFGLICIGLATYFIGNRLDSDFVKSIGTSTIFATPKIWIPSYKNLNTAYALHAMVNELDHDNKPITMPQIPWYKRIFYNN